MATTNLSLKDNHRPLDPLAAALVNTLATVLEAVYTDWHKVSTKTGDYTVTADDGVILVDASGGPVIITLPPVADIGTDKLCTVKKIDASANPVTLDGDGAETIDGETSQIIDRQYTSLTVICNGTAWYIL